MAQDSIKTILARLNNDKLGILSELLIENFSNIFTDSRSDSLAATSSQKLLTHLEKLNDDLEHTSRREPLSDFYVELKSFTQVNEEECAKLNEEIRSLNLRLTTQVDVYELRVRSFMTVYDLILKK